MRPTRPLPEPGARWQRGDRCRAGKSILLLLLLLTGFAAPAQSPALQTLEFLHDLKLSAPAPAPLPASGPGSVVYAIGSGAGAAGPALRAGLQLAAAPDSVTIRVTASHPGLGTAIQTVAGRAGPRTLELRFRPTAAPAIEATDLTLLWEAKTGSGPWQRFASSRHRLYWVLAAPGAPWAGLPEPDGGHALWTAMLELSCQAAAGTRTPEQAASAVTRFVHGGRAGAAAPTKFQYNPMLPDANLTHLDAVANRYVVRTQQVQALLASLQNPAMTHLQLNCYDAAGCVQLLGNALGCTLKRVKVNSAYYLVTHKLVPMGFTKPAKADFRVHCVAWSGPLDERGLVYDACFALPAAAPASAPDTPLAALLFGHSRQPGSYAATVFTNKEDFYLTPLPALLIRQ
ncbi:hypothetical protein [Hymenobacter daecheongensis]|uniref:hypothetical protein n=1 Tax=Hymenobacter daecheongensis TaxID=496053 RepID=UPI0013565D34|nr:hypothetical protein [Hymenobacter daecheongensis]